MNESLGLPLGNSDLEQFARLRIPPKLLDAAGWGELCKRNELTRRSIRKQPAQRQ